MKTDITVEQAAELFRTRTNREKIAWWIFAMNNYRNSPKLAEELRQKILELSLTLTEEEYKLRPKALSDEYSETYNLVD